MERLTAKENMYLTQVEEVTTLDRVYCSELVCPDGEADNWRDADEEEYQQWLEDYELLMAEQEDSGYSEVGNDYE